MNMTSILLHPWTSGYSHLCHGVGKGSSQLSTRLFNIVGGILLITAFPVVLIAASYYFLRRKVEIIPPSPPPGRDKNLLKILTPKITSMIENQKPAEQVLPIGLTDIPTHFPKNEKEGASSFQDPVPPEIPEVHDLPSNDGNTLKNRPSQEDMSSKESNPPIQFNPRNKSGATFRNFLRMREFRQGVAALPDERLRKDPEFMRLEEIIAPLHSNQLLTDEEHITARQAQIKAGSLMLECLPGDKDLIASNAKIYLHVDSMLQLANHYLSQFEEPELENRKRKNISDEIRIKYLKWGQEWYLKAFHQFTADKFIYIGKDQIEWTQNIKKLEETLADIKENMNVMTRRMRTCQQGKECLNYAYAVACEKGDIKIQTLLHHLIGARNILLGSALIHLYLKASEKQCPYALKVLYYFNKIAKEFASKKDQEVKEAIRDYESLKPINEDNYSQAEVCLDHLIDTRIELKKLEDIITFIEKEGKEDEKVKDIFLIQAFLYFRQAAKSGSKEALEFQKKIETAMKGNLLASDSIYTLLTTLPKEDAMIQFISLEDVKELMKAIEPPNTPKESFWPLIEILFMESQDKEIRKYLTVQLKALANQCTQAAEIMAKAFFSRLTKKVK